MEVGEAGADSMLGLREVIEALIALRAEKS